MTIPSPHLVISVPTPRSIRGVAWLVLLWAALSGCEHRSPPAPAAVPALVKVAAVVSAGDASDLHLSGTLEAKRFLTLSFPVLGTVEQVLVQEGATVRRGQLLARISPSSYQDAVNLAKIKLDQAEDGYRRLRPMYDEGALPEVKLVEVEAGREQARLALTMATQSLNDTNLRAPEPGIVAKRHAEPGSSAAPGVPIITLVQTQTLLATAPLPESRIGRIAKGAGARVVVPALDKTFDGVVSDIGIVADPLTRTYEIKVEVPNPDKDLRVGMVADVQIRGPARVRALVVPPEAVRIDELGEPCVYVVAPDRRVQRRNVKVAGYVAEGTALEHGVVEGELVVVSGTPMLADGVRVRVLERRKGGV